MTTWRADRESSWRRSSSSRGPASPSSPNGFDVPELPATMRYGFATIGYQPEAAASSSREVEQFLRR